MIDERCFINQYFFFELEIHHCNIVSVTVKKTQHWPLTSNFQSEPVTHKLTGAEV